jgi:hypothetical protein
VGSLNQVVAAGCPDDLLMVDLLKCWKFSDGGPVTGKFVRADRLWDVIFAEQASQERSCRFGISVTLQQDVEHDPVLVHGSPEPVTDTADGGTDFVHVPPGTPSGFPVTQLFSDERREFDVPLAKRVVADLNPALLEQLLHIPVAEREAVVQPNCMLDDADREAMTIGRGVSH